jgi:tetratricopeptide (TPR) repeat protein
MKRFLMKSLIGFTGLALGVLCSGLLLATEAPSLPGKPLKNIPQSDYQPSRDADLMYHVLVAEIAVKRGQLELAMESYLKAAADSDDARLAERAVSVALFLGRLEAALEAARRWYELDPKDEKARQTLALVLLRSGSVTESLEQLEALLEDGRDDGQDGFATLGALLGQLDDKDTLFEVMGQLRVRYPQSPFAQYYFALAALGKEDREQVLEGLNNALRLKPDWHQARLLRAQVMMEMGRTDEAVRDLAQAVAEQPDDASLRLGYARLLVSAGQLAQAEAEFRLLVEQNPDNTEALFALGLLSAEARRFDQARDYFMTVMRLGARLMEVYFELGRLEELQENYAEARDWYNRVTSEDRRLSAQVRVANTFARTEAFSELAAHMVALRRDYPENVVALYLTEAELLREMKRYQPAFDLLDQALAEHPDNNDLLYSRALIAERLDRLDVLEANLRTIIAADPDNGHALNALGYTLADRTDRYEEALGYLERAIKILPDDAAVLDSMGWVKYRLGDYDVSLDYLRRAYEASPDAEIASHLTEVLWVDGQQERARQIWQRANEKDPDNEYLLEVKGRLGL